MPKARQRRLGFRHARQRRQDRADGDGPAVQRAPPTARLGTVAGGLGWLGGGLGGLGGLGGGLGGLGNALGGAIGVDTSNGLGVSVGGANGVNASIGGKGGNVASVSVGGVAGANVSTSNNGVSASASVGNNGSLASVGASVGTSGVGANASVGRGSVGMLGVSLGGLVGAEACRTDPRLKACLTEDVFVPRDVIAAGLAQPAMWLASDAASMAREGWPQWEVDLHQQTMRAAYEAARADAYFVHVPGMFHLNFTDFPYTLATPIARALHLIGPIDWRRGHDIVDAYALAFFDRHLKAKDAPLLAGPSPAFAEVSLESRHP